MHDMDENSFATYVREKHIVITPQRLGDLFQIPPPSNSVYPFPDPNDTQYEYDAVASILCGRECSWAGGLIYEYEMELD